LACSMTSTAVLIAPLSVRHSVPPPLSTA
jgi:hypothetical protein